MADVKISALPSGSTLDGTEVVPIVQSSSTVKVTTQAIANLTSLASGATLFMNRQASNATGTIAFPKAFTPVAGSTYPMGNSGFSWVGGYFDNLYAPNGTLRYNLVDNRIGDSSGNTVVYPDSKALAVNGTVVNTWAVANFNPGADNTQDLGTNTLRYKDVFFNKIHDVNNGTGSAGEVLTAIGDGTFDWAAASGGANVNLSNITGTSLPASLLFDTADNYTVGSQAKPASNGWIIRGRSATQFLYTGSALSTLAGVLAGGATDTPSVVSTILSLSTSTAGTGNELGIWTASNATNDANPTNDVRVETGNKTAGTGGSGNVIIRTGTSAGGTAGSVQILNDATKILVPKTITAGGTTGNRTIDKISGTVNVAAAGTTVTVTCAQCATTSIVFAVIRTNDATATIKNVVPGAGSFVITLTAGATAEVSIGFLVMN